MRGTWLKRARWALLLGVMAVAPGCLAAAAAAGAGAGIYLTDQGASGTVQGSLSDVDRRTQAVFTQMGIRVDERKVESDEIEYRGTAGGGMEVHAELEPGAGSTTTVNVSARRNQVQYDKDYARDLISRIVQTR